MKKILIIEDNDSIIKGVKYLLEQESFTVEISKTIREARKKIIDEDIVLVLLDVMLPDGDGVEFCSEIKEESFSKPIIFLTAKEEENDVVIGLEAGADDYIIKPFRARELVSRINNVLRRYEFKNNEIRYNNLKIRVDEKRVFKNEEEIIFTALEYKILLLLYSNVNKTITREQILNKIWDIAGNFVNDNTLTVYIKRIRAKLGEEDGIKTIKGIGYRVENSQKEPQV